MSLPPLDLTPIGTEKKNGTTSPIDSILVRKKTPEPTPLTKPTDLPEQNEKVHIPGEPDPYPSSSYSPANKYNSSNDSKSSKWIKKKSDKKKKVSEKQETGLVRLIVNIL